MTQVNCRVIWRMVELSWVTLIRKRALFLTVTKAITLEKILTVKRWAASCSAVATHCFPTPATLLPLISAPATLKRSLSRRGIHCAIKVDAAQTLHGVSKHSLKGGRQTPSPTVSEQNVAAWTIWVHVQREQLTRGYTTKQRGPTVSHIPLMHRDGTENMACGMSVIPMPMVNCMGAMRKESEM